MPQLEGFNTDANFDFNGLVSRPRPISRGLFNLFGRIHVQPGTCALLTGNQGFEAALGPGNHTRLSLPAGPIVMQVVNMTVQNRPVPSVSALSRDKWQVTLEGMLSFQVADPFKAANSAPLLEILDHATRAALLSLIEEFEHDELTGRTDASPKSPEYAPGEGEEAPASGIPALCSRLVELLKADQSLAALLIISFHVTSRSGDERRIQIAQESSVEQTRVLEENRVKRLQHQVQLLEAGAELELKQQELKLRELELSIEREAAQNSELIRLMRSETEAKSAYLMRAEREWQAQQKRQEDEWRVAREFDMLQLKSRHEEAIEAIRGTTIVSAEAAQAGQLGNLNISPRRKAELAGESGANSQSSVISQGLQALKDLPSSGSSYAYFLPNRLQSGNSSHSNSAGNEPEGFAFEQEKSTGGTEQGKEETGDGQSRISQEPAK